MRNWDALPPVFLPVGQLPLDVLHRRAAAVTEPGRELLRAVLTEVAVFQFLIAQQSDLLAADVAVFLIKQSHNSFLLLFSVAVTAHIALSTRNRDLGPRPWLPRPGTVFAKKSAIRSYSSTF